MAFLSLSKASLLFCCASSSLLKRSRKLFLISAISAHCLWRASFSLLSLSISACSSVFGRWVSSIWNLPSEETRRPFFCISISSLSSSRVRWDVSSSPPLLLCMEHKERLLSDWRWSSLPSFSRTEGKTIWNYLCFQSKNILNQLPLTRVAAHRSCTLKYCL